MPFVLLAGAGGQAVPPLFGHPHQQNLEVGGGFSFCRFRVQSRQSRRPLLIDESCGTRRRRPCGCRRLCWVNPLQSNTGFTTIARPGSRCKLHALARRGSSSGSRSERVRTRCRLAMLLA